MEKARCNTELYSNLREPLNNVKPSNFGGSLEKSEYAVTANDLKNKSDIPILLFLSCTGYQ